MTADTKPRYDAATVKTDARNRWLEILQNLAGVTLPEREGPCPRCEGKTRCRFTNRDGDGSCYCSHCHTDGGDGFAALQWLKGCTFREAVDMVGEYLHTSPTPAMPASTKQKSVEPASVDVRHQVYSTILSLLPLDEHHRQSLRDRGLSDEAIDREQFRTINKATEDDRTACDAAKRGLNGHAAEFARVPGIMAGRLIAKDGIIFPVRNVAGQIVALKVRRDDVGPNEPRYTYVSSRACSCGSPVHVPLSVKGTVKRARVTEGEVKAVVAGERSGLPTIAAPSVNSWQKVIPALNELQTETVVLSFDADAVTNENVAKHLAAAYDGLAEAGFAVELETWDASQGKGIDDLLAAGGTPRILTGAMASAWLGKITGKQSAHSEHIDFDESEYTPELDEYADAQVAEMLAPTTIDTVSAVVQPLTAQRKPGKISYKTISAAELARGTYTIEFLIEDCLVAMQPLVLAGGKKCLKTNNMLDAAISVVSGTDFLGKFRVNRCVNVGVMSGESGIATIQETCLRICEAKGISLARDCEGLFFSEDLPRIGDEDHNEALQQWITDLQLGLIVLDPAYLCMPAEDNGNLFAQGELLRQLTTICSNAGAGIIVAHHTKKKLADPWQPAELEDIAWSGWQEFARQWWLLSRQCKYDPERCGHHELWLNIGGSAGHSSLWGVTIDEGSRKDPGGRRWDVDVKSATQARIEGVEQAEANKIEAATKRQLAKIAATREAIIAAFRAAPGHADTKTKLQEASGCRGKGFDTAWGELLREKRIIETEITRSNGQKYPGFTYEGDLE